MGSSLASLSETVSSVASNVVESVGPANNGNKSGTNAASRGVGSQGDTSEDDPLSQNWNYVKSSAFDFFSKAAQATTDVVKTIQEIQGGDDDNDAELFPKRELKAYSTGNMSGVKGGTANNDDDGVFSFRKNLQSSSTGKMQGVGSGGGDFAKLERSSHDQSRGNSGALTGGSMSRGSSQSSNNFEQGDLYPDNNDSVITGRVPSRSGSNNSFDGKDKTLAAVPINTSSVSPRTIVTDKPVGASVVKKMTPPSSNDDFFGSFGVGDKDK